jgi:hypothetical protein
MQENDEKKRLLVNKLEYILRIHLEDFQSKQQAVVKNQVTYSEFIRSIISRTFATVGFLATALIAIAAFKILEPIHNTQLFLLILLLIDLAVGAITFGVFGNHSRSSKAAWSEIENAYNASIAHINELRIFLTEKEIIINETNAEKLFLLSSCYLAYLLEDLIRIHQALQDTLNSIFSSSFTAGLLIRESNKQNKLIKNVYKKYALNQNEFEKEKDFLGDLYPQLGMSCYLPLEGGQATSAGLSRVERYFNNLAKKYWNRKKSPRFRMNANLNEE